MGPLPPASCPRPVSPGVINVMDWSLGRLFNTKKALVGVSLACGNCTLRWGSWLVGERVLYIISPYISIYRVNFFFFLSILSNFVFRVETATWRFFLFMFFFLFFFRLLID
jgi:hypothetical protein